MVQKRLVLLMLAIFPLSACGPNRAAIREFILNSPHRSIAVLPFDQALAQKNYSTVASDGMTMKLLRIGFAVADANKTKGLWNHSPVKGHFFDDEASAVAMGKALGMQAVLVGMIDQAYEASQNIDAVYSYETVPPPPCCATIPRSCAQSSVYDPVLKTQVDICTTHHRRITETQGVHNRTAGYAVRVRLLDTATGNVVWEGQDNEESTTDSLARLADNAGDSISEQLLENLMKTHR